MARDRKNEKQYKLSPDVQIPTFQVKHLETDEIITVDDRTFDPDIHQKLDAPVEEKKPKAKKDK